MGASTFLLVILAVFSSGGWAYPGKIETASTSSAASTSPGTDSPHGGTTVYHTTCNKTLEGTISSTSSKVSIVSSCHGSPTIISTGHETAPFPSHVQSASSHQGTGQSASYTFTKPSFFHILTAQSASSVLIPRQSTSHNFSASQHASQTLTTRNNSSSSSRPTLQTSGSNSNASSTSSHILASSSSSSATSSFSFSVPSGYSLVKLSTSSSTESVPSGWSLEALSTLSTSSSTSSISLTTQSSSMTTSISQNSTISSAVPSSTSSGLLSSAPLSSYNSTSYSSSVSFSASTSVASSSLTGSISSNASVATGAATSIVSVSSTSAASAPSIASVASVASASKIAASETATAANCNDGTWDLTIANYLKANTDANLKTWWHGGTDNETGVTFPAKTAPGTFLTEALAGSFQPVGEQYVCTLESHSCQPADGCASEFK